MGVDAVVGMALYTGRMAMPARIRLPSSSQGKPLEPAGSKSHRRWFDRLSPHFQGKPLEPLVRVACQLFAFPTLVILN